MLLGGLIILLIFIAFFDCGGNGLFIQKRIGQRGKSFKIFKIRTIHLQTQYVSTFGKFVRSNKLDELPQLVNILFGQMSFVGPRPDIEGYYDRLQGEARKLLELKPGLCSEAALKYYNEEKILAQQRNPLNYNDRIIFPDKVKMNLEYYYRQSLSEDFLVIRTCAITILRSIIKKVFAI